MKDEGRRKQRAKSKAQRAEGKAQSVRRGDYVGSNVIRPRMNRDPGYVINDEGRRVKTR